MLRVGLCIIEDIMLHERRIETPFFAQMNLIAVERDKVNLSL